jgi:fatty acid desaturase
MSYDGRISENVQINAWSPSERSDPRFEMSQRLPRVVQPFLTWLTAKPAAGEAIRERNPLRFVAIALAQVVVGVATTLAAAALPWAVAIPVAILGLLVTSSGLGLFQVVIFHHCSHFTVFKVRQMNIRVGRLISAVLLFKHFDVYQREHMLHHNHKKLLTMEDEFADFIFGMCRLEAATAKRKLWRRVLVGLASPAFHLRFLVRRVRAAWGSHDRAHNVTGMAVWAAIAIAAIASAHPWLVALAWVLPVTVLLQIATVFRILCEHRFPEPELIANRTRDFAEHASVGVFTGAALPDPRLPAVRRTVAWTIWWADMLTVQLFARVFVMVGDAPCHDYHHHRPASRKWTSYIQARQHDLDAGRHGYQEVWGLFRAVDENLASLTRTPQGVLEW